jgi:ferredoxin-NADP reductase
VSVQHDVGLIDSTRCDDTLTLRFERPRNYDFVPGQYFVLTVSTENGEESKPFSHASAPDADHLEMTTRVSGSAFKRVLAAAEPGTLHARIRGPAGRFGLREDDPAPPVFLAGGVGITPIMSILRSARHASRELGAALIYGNAVDRCVPYREEIQALDGRLVRTTLVVERPESGWTGPSGFITPDTVRACVPDIPSHCYYVTGPPAMVEAMGPVLDELGIPGAWRRVEKFGR